MNSGKLLARIQRDYTPVSWTQYFDEAHDIQVANSSETTNDTFRVYLKNFKEPFAPDREFGTQLDFNKLDLTETQINGYSKVPTLVALHGGGYSALTWAQFTRHIELHCHCRLLAIDLRGHGDTSTADDDQMDIETLVKDVISVTHETHRICGFPDTPKIVLLGHSMGGAIAVKCATKSADHLPSLAGFVVIDVVEGTAKEALPLMMSVIKTRPIKFPTLSNAIEWSVRSGLAKNADAARVSMPGNLVNISSERLAIHDVSPGTNINLKEHKFKVCIQQLASGQALPAALLPRPPLDPRVASIKRDEASIAMPPPPPRPPLARIESLTEKSVIEEEMEFGTVDSAQTFQDVGALDSGYTWRTNLAKTQPYWNDWFDGLSNQLLDAPVQGKFLLLAGIDRLDKALTIGQMQGKFMMRVLPKCGHAVHEDVPEQVASAIGDFLVRNKFATSASSD